LSDPQRHPRGPAPSSASSCRTRRAKFVCADPPPPQIFFARSAIKGSRRRRGGSGCRVARARGKVALGRSSRTSVHRSVSPSVSTHQCSKSMEPERSLRLAGPPNRLNPSEERTPLSGVVDVDDLACPSSEDLVRLGHGVCVSARKDVDDEGRLRL